ncbi:MAG: Zinc metalloprotease [Candidatus Nitrospira kreftii]|uniref:Zinc metalloprotease n=1 Tax=Candidatus Nitrospira kreftii TaxID=2652173 RepID=A0A7S8FH83_9BACT|nr:MAG: Zinc metalloprotease [Candidatus Nitrospira kreftii]
MHMPSWKIGRALGIPIRVHASWFLVFFLATWSLSTGYLPDSLPGLSPERYWAMGAVAAILLFFSVLLHELGHSYVALYYRIPIDQITLFIFGGVAHMRREAPSPQAEFLIAVAGPAVSFVIGGICFLLVLLAEAVQRQQGLQGVIMLGVLLGMVNVQLGLFNLIPGFPLDGGRVLRAGLWAWGKDFYRATRQAAVVGLAFGAIFGLVGLIVVYGAASGELPAAMMSNGGWVVFIGMFLFAAALASRRQAVLRQSLATIPIRDMMVTTVVSIPAQCTLHEAVNQYFQAYGYGGFPVLDDRRLVGLLTVFEVQGVAPALWAWRQVDHVMRPVSESLVITPEVPVIHAMERMARGGWDRLVVMQDGEVVGLVTQSAIVHFLQLRRG